MSTEHPPISTELGENETTNNNEDSNNSNSNNGNNNMMDEKVIHETANNASTMTTTGGDVEMNAVDATIETNDVTETITNHDSNTIQNDTENPTLELESESNREGEETREESNHESTANNSGSVSVNDSVNMSVEQDADTSADESADNCFFADAILDLEDARCIEETPEVHNDNYYTTAATAADPNATSVSGVNDSAVIDSNSTVNANQGGKQLLSQFNQTLSTASSQSNNANPNAAPQLTSNQIQTKSQSQPSNTSPSNTNTNNNNSPSTSTNQIQPQRIVHNNNSMTNLAPTTQPKPPRRPRDVKYILIYFTSILILFLILFIPCLIQHNNSKTKPGLGLEITTSAKYNHVIIPTIITTVLSISSSRYLYCTRGGDEGDDARYTISTILFISNLASCLSMPILTLQIYYLNVVKDEDLFWYHLLIMGFVYFSVREIYIFATLFRSGNGSGSSSSSNPYHMNINNTNNNSNNIDSNIVNLNENINDGQRTMFRMLVNISLDVLSRSLRPMNLFRFISTVVVLQFVILHIILNRLICASSIGGDNDNANSGGGSMWLILMVVIMSYWVIFSFIKLLALVCSGGITCWFAQQSLLMERMEYMRRKEEMDHYDEEEEMNSLDHHDDSSNLDSNGTAITTTSKENRNGNGNGNGNDKLMPEAYRSVDANAYSSIIEFDEGMDDDFDYDEEDDGLVNIDIDRSDAAYGSGNNSSGHGSGGMMGSGMGMGMGNYNGNSGNRDRDWQNINIKSFLFYGATLSLGSVLQCALLGPIATFTDSAIYYIDRIITILTYTRGRRGVGADRHGFQGMTIISSSDNYGDNDLGQDMMSMREKIYVNWKRVESKAKQFVQNHNDLGLCHVAAYYKKYQRASYDVMTLVNASGTSSIMNNDISSHMCTSVSKAISIILVILMGQPLSLRSSGLDHSSVCKIMVATYIMCFIILNTLMEPLRASIKAVYVSFAQHPQSLSQAFPLLYHRLNRISEE